MCVAETALFLCRRRASTDPHEAELVRINEKHVLDIQNIINILLCRRKLLYDILLILSSGQVLGHLLPLIT